MCQTPQPVEFRSTPETATSLKQNHEYYEAVECPGQ